MAQAKFGSVVAALWLTVAALTASFILAADKPKKGEKAAPIAIADIKHDGPVSFEKEILPILAKNCLACHNATTKENGLVLESPAAILKGGDEGPAVVAKKSAESLLLKVASHTAEPAMPPADNDVKAVDLKPEELGLLKLWIDEGAIGDASAVAGPVKWQPLPAGVNPIYSAAITSDGQYAACGRANQIFVYHLASGRLITRLTDPAVLKSGLYKGAGVAHLDLVQSLAFSPDGDLLASGAYREVKLWRRPHNVHKADLALSATPVQAIAVSPDGKLTATGTVDGSITLVGPDGKLLAVKSATAFKGHTAAITGLRFLPDGLSLVSSSLDKSVRIWNVAEGTQTSRIDTPAAVNALAIIGDGAQLATGGADNLVRIWTRPTVAARQLEGAPPVVAALAGSPDKKSFALAADDGSIVLFDAATGKATKTLPGRKVAVTALSYTADGARLAAAEADGALRVWDIAKGEPLVVLQASVAPLSAVAINPTGTQVVSGNAEGKLAVWKLDVAAPAPLAGALEAAPTAAAVSLDGKQLAVGGMAGGKPAILVRDVASGAISKTLLGHEGPITALAFSSDGAKLISGSADKTARIWTLADGKETAKFAGHAAAVTAVAINAGGAQGFSGAADNSLKSWNGADGVELKNFAGHAGPVSGLALTSNGQTLLSSSADMTVRVWNTADGAQAKSLPQAGPVTALALTRDDSKFAAALGDGSIKLAQVADGKELFALAAGKVAAKTLAFSGDNLRLAATADKQASVWEVATGSLVEILPAASGAAYAAFTATPGEVLLASADKSVVRSMLHFERAAIQTPPAAAGTPAKPITGLQYKKDGSAFYAASGDGTVRGFTIANGQQTFSANHAAAVNCLALSPDGKSLASAGEDMLVKVWNAEGGAPGAKPQLAGFTGPAKSVSFSSDSLKVVASAIGKTAPEVIVFNLATGTPDQLFSEHTGPVTSLAVVGETAPLVVSASADKTVRLWGLAAGLQIAGHTKPITALAYAPADKTLISAGEENSIKQWNLQTGAAMKQFDHGSPVTALVIRGDGLQMASAGANNLIKLWNLQNGQAWTLANNQPIAPMSGDQRAQLKVAKLERMLASVTARIADNKKTITEAEAKVKTSAEAITAADKAKEAAAKTHAEKTAAAKAPAEAKAAADKELEAAAAVAKTAMEKAVAAKTAFDADNKNADLGKANEAAAKEATEAEKKRKDAEKKATDAGVPATKAAQEATAAEAANMAAEQAAAAAIVTNKKAIDAVPIAQAATKVSEDLLVTTKAESEAAKKVVTDMDKPIRALAYSADNGQLASGGDNMLVRTWSAETGAPIETYDAHKGPVTAVAFEADGAIVSAAADKTAIIWDANAGWTLERTIGVIDSPAQFVDRVLALAFSPDGKTLATGGGEPSRSGELKLWNVADAPVKTIVDAHSDTIFGLDFSPDGKDIASCAADRFVKVFGVADGKLVRSFEGHTHHVLDVAWRADGKFLASVGADNVLKVWDFLTGDQKLTSQPLGKEMTSISFVGETPKALISSGDKTVRLYNTDNGNSEKSFGGAADFMFCTAATPDGKIAIGGGQDSTLFVWNIENGQAVRSFEAPKGDKKEADAKETAKK